MCPLHGIEKFKCREKRAFHGGDKPANNGDNRQNSCRANFAPRGNPFVIAPRTSALLIAAIAGGVVLQPPRAHAQWWGSRAPVDFEECADRAEKATTREARTAALSECNAKFAGRRKPGGGYTYFDFMQNRNFDIAGPNPTPEEQKHIDEQYTAYLDNQRRSTIAAAFAAKQQQLKQSSPKPSSLNQESLKQESLKQTSPKNESEKAPTTSSIGKPKASAGDARRPKATDSRATDSRATDCAQHSFSCDWPRLSESIKDLKKVLFGSSSSKDKRS
jgi:hypothetical protein